MRIGDWKLVAEWDRPWELYNMVDDRTELNDLSGSERERVRMLVEAYEGWAGRCGVLPWPVHPDMVAKRLKGKHAHISQHRAPLSGKMR